MPNVDTKSDKVLLLGGSATPVPSRPLSLLSVYMQDPLLQPSFFPCGTTVSGSDYIDFFETIGDDGGGGRSRSRPPRPLRQGATMITTGTLNPDPASWRLDRDAVQVDDDRPASPDDPFRDDDRRWHEASGRGWS